MKKMDVRAVLDDFERQATYLCRYYRRVANALAGTQHEKADTSLLAEQSFFTLAVAFEICLSEFTVACVNRDCVAVQDDLEKRIRESIKGRYPGWLASNVGRISFDKASHLTVVEVEEILDLGGWNVSFASAQDFVDKSQRWFTSPYKRKVAGLTDHDKRAIDAVRSVRHLMAHRSGKAYADANDTLGQVDQGPPNEHLGRGQHKVNSMGSFLKSQFGGRSRFELYCDRLVAVARKLKP